MLETISRSPEAAVIVIGAAGLDIIGKLLSDLKTGTSSPAHIRTSFGGVARNVAENLARLGQPVKLVSAVGNDANGEQLTQQLSAVGVDVQAVLKTNEHPTGSYLGVVDKAGKLHYALDDMRAINALTPAYLRSQAHLFEQAALVFIDVNLRADTLRTVFSLAAKNKLPVCADPTSTTLAPRLCRYLERIYLITPNSAEATIICSRPLSDSQRQQAMESAKYLVNRGVKIALITLAEFGVCYATSETSGYIPAIQTEIVDPTGAGDALSAAVIFALLNDIPLDDAIRLGVTAASLTLRQRGTVLNDLSLEKLYENLII